MLFALAGGLACTLVGLHGFFAGASACGQGRGEDEFDLLGNWNFFGDDEPAAGLNPGAGIVDVGIDADGLDGRDGITLGVGDALDDVVERAANVTGAEEVEPGGACVAVEDLAASKMVFADDGFGASPMDEVEVDVIAVRMAADDAETGVAILIGGGIGLV